VEIVRGVYEGWAQGNFNSGVMSPDFEWQQLSGAVEPGSRRGEQVGNSLRRLFEVYEDVRVEAEEFVDAGDRVVVVGLARATARRSGMELNQRFAFVWTVSDGVLIRMEMYPERREALEAVGLQE